MDRSPDVEVAEVPPVGEPGRKSIRRTQRIRTACVRCQRRKIKCDGGTPACSSCRKAGADCVDGLKQGERYSKAYVSSLHDRIRWLEAIVERCTEVDLCDGPKINFETDGRNDSQNESPINVQNSQVTYGENVDPAISQQPQAPTIDETTSTRPHEIGWVSVTGGQDARYVGPSSGYSFAKLVLANIGRRSANRRRLQQNQPLPQLPREFFDIHPMSLPPSLDHAVQLSAAYWENVHCQYPFLHEPSHIKLMESMYMEENKSPSATFQVFMVLAISTTILSRRLKVQLSAEGYCAAAMTQLNQIQFEGSLEGLQCLLLLQIYGMNNPSMGSNLWHLNYQCIASVLDLGLQRDVKSGKNLSLFTQELRTRIFWVVYNIDRGLATTLGRPIGLRDEACELRLPQDISDENLFVANPRPREAHSPPTSITNAIHLHKLAQLNSEIKYVGNSISHKTPAYTYPQIPNILDWQRDVLYRLQQWEIDIPKFNDTQLKWSKIRYHEVMMLLLRPSPAIPSPSHDTLQLCHENALGAMKIYEELYRDGFLLYSWLTLHSVFLSAVTMLYCVWAVPRIARDTNVESLIVDVNAATRIMSALGEHWIDAKKGRDVLDELSNATVKWILESRTSTRSDDEQPRTNQNTCPSHFDTRNSPPLPTKGPTGGHHGTTEMESQSMVPPFTSSMDVLSSSEPWMSLFGMPDETSFGFELDSIMQGVFNEFDAEYMQNAQLDNQVADDAASQDFRILP